MDSVVGTAITTFDGAGAFTQTDNIHGSITGFSAPDRPGKGSYSINSDCTGTMILNNDGVPFGLVLSIAIVDIGKEIRAAVVSTTTTVENKQVPPPIMVTSNGKRM